MKLTKDQRHTAYIIMLHEAETDFEHWSSGWGLCHLIRVVFDLCNKDNYGWFDRVIDENFPELLNKRGFLGWPLRDIDGWKERIGILKQCIEETYNF